MNKFGRKIAASIRKFKNAPAKVSVPSAPSAARITSRAVQAAKRPNKPKMK